MSSIMTKKCLKNMSKTPKTRYSLEWIFNSCQKTTVRRNTTPIRPQGGSKNKLPSVLLSVENQIN